MAVHRHKASLRAVLGLLQKEVGERAAAIESRWTAYLLEPENFHANAGLGSLFLDAGDLEAARMHLEAARRRKPEDPGLRRLLERLARLARLARPAHAPR